MSLEPAGCPLCKSPAERAPLRSHDGYSYVCPSCGSYHIDGLAYGKATRGHVAAHVHVDVRRLQAEGEIPRIEFNAPDFVVKPVARGKQ
ncbi:hypothetical protein [Cupriavidus sp. CuC1]|uniref:hypothetical protein n=1 Tax=Cupriavidus sp. CuC1 TaxID=3373131 RepID=UPI0037CE9FB8